MSVRLRRLDSRDGGFAAALSALLTYTAEADAAIESTVAAILADVRARGDAAVLEYTRRFDAIDAGSVGELEIGAGELAAARDGLPSAQRSALEAAAARVRDFHQRQLEATGRS